MNGGDYLLDRFLGLFATSFPPLSLPRFPETLLLTSAAFFDGLPTFFFDGLLSCFPCFLSLLFFNTLSFPFPPLPSTFRSPPLLAPLPVFFGVSAGELFFILFKKSTALFFFSTGKASFFFFSGLGISDFSGAAAFVSGLVFCFLLREVETFARFFPLLVLLAPVTGFSSDFIFSKPCSAVGDFRSLTGGFRSLTGLFSLICCCCCSIFCPKLEEDGLAEIELRLRQTILGMEDLCFASNESDLSSSRLGWEGIFSGTGVESDLLVFFLISFMTRDLILWAMSDSTECLGKKTRALLKRSKRSRKNRRIEGE
ncbi:hypothetical protein OIU84_025752 [Salix udensis]|uniref:Uncharacterized protein n=1 Tax=Salix udensis TaxID=889485 RepID=A0AAD6KKB8_9ROSI|nr:hypothetical protein OIU84_025752 [Salix udensis]